MLIKTVTMLELWCIIKTNVIYNVSVVVNVN